MSKIPLTRIAAFRPFPAFLEANGCDVVRQLRSFGIAAENLSSEESLVPLPLAGEFVDQVAKREGVDRLGLEAGSRASMREIGLFGKILSQSLSLKDMLEKMVRFTPSLTSCASIRLEAVPGRPDSLRLIYRQEVAAGRTIVNGYALLMYIDAVRMVAGPAWRPKWVALAGEAGEAARYEALSEARVDREVDHAAFEIPRSLLGLPLRRAGNKGSHDLSLEAAMEHSAPSEDLVESICQSVRAGFGVVVPTIDRVALMTGTSVSTVQRRLRERGVSYQGLVDRVRFEEARRLMADAKLAIAEIAQYLGFSDAANFTHAFRRWTGESPRAYCRRMLPL